MPSYVCEVLKGSSPPLAATLAVFFSSAATWLSLIGLAALSTALAYIVFFQSLARSGAANVMLVTLLIRVQRAGQRLLAIGLDDHYRQILSLTRLDEAIQIHDSEAAAIAAAT